MPWHVTNDRAECDGYAVVKDENGEIVGCHRNETQALKQLAALHIAEPNVRAGSGPLAIISDIDGTLISNDRPNTALINRLNESDAIVIVVTARSAERRAATVELLNRIGLEYDSLRMSNGGDPTAYKRQVAEQLLERYTINTAYENNPDTRAAYEELGINALAPYGNRDAAQEILAQIISKR